MAKLQKYIWGKVCTESKTTVYRFAIPVIKLVQTDKKIKVYVCGLRVLTTKKEQKSMYSQEQIVKFYSQVWHQNGTSENLCAQLGLFFDVANNLNDATKKLYLIYIQNLIEQNHTQRALLCVRRYISKFTIDILDTFLPVAHFAYQNGIQTENTKKAFVVWEQLQKNRKNKVLEKYLKNKTVAVVGNNGCEINSGHGKIIDKHDVVVRFNNFPTGYESDYGTKTGIWVRHRGTDINDRDIANMDIVLWNEDLGHNIMFEDNRLDLLYDQISKHPTKVCYVPLETYKNIYDASYVLSNPTSGAVAIWMLYKEIKGIKDINVYGFAFRQKQNEENLTHYYDNKCTLAKDHDMDDELLFLRKIDLEYHNKTKSNIKGK